jgi:hypothetical protein
VGNAANVSEVQYASIFDPEVAGSIHIKMLATSSIPTWSNNPKTDLTPIINHHEHPTIRNSTVTHA